MTKPPPLDIKDDQHKGLPVHGYQPQSDANVQRVNVNKQMEEMLLQRLDEIADDGNADARWLSIARTHFEQGFMALNRAIFKPQRLKMPSIPRDG